MQSMSVVVEVGEQDGRSRRRLHSYERAVDAVLDLIEGGVASPTAQQIADRSGISIRTVFRLTDDVESLHAAAVQRQTERITALYVNLSAGGSLGERIDALVENRAIIFETIAPVRRVAERLASGSDLIADGLARHHRFLGAQIGSVFGRELAALPPPVRRDTLHAATVAASWETWDQLRRTLGLSRQASSRAMRRLLHGALHPGDALDS
jgi:TetR/AcrR family transcriptional regulator of autoinduction and epiphytic fitness